MAHAIARLVPLILAALPIASSAPAAVQAQPVAAACGPAAPLAPAITRASVRFAIPEALIRAVIAVESNWQPFAVSPKGAMGLMQLMPGTWGELRARYALGPDPFDPCDNILAGTAYLRELLDRYGDPGFLAAYNAGPGRYEAYLRGVKSLPTETLAYVGKLSMRKRDNDRNAPAAMPDRDGWRRGSLFAADRDPEREPTAGQDAHRSDPPRDTIFVPRTGLPQ
ncbi:lytic transglycosylase domain-containing protein [Sphingomonas sp.]|uniref:lytic transglycosylase domain-containing protein n=1 Tax=Sphingomonas sp. TaxID=28214 RepID=UPI003F719C63